MSVFCPPSISIISLVLTDLIGTHVCLIHNDLVKDDEYGVAGACQNTIRFYGAKFETSAAFEGLNKTKARNDGNGN